ncbi:MAG: thioredoxin [Saprospiraceae bacterium]
MSKNKSSFQNIINSETPILIDFYADWCGPCKMFAHTIDNLKNEIGDQARIIKINVDKNQALSQQLQVRSIPTVMIYQNGEMKWRAQGAQSIQTMKQQLAQLV